MFSCWVRSRGADGCCVEAGRAAGVQMGAVFETGRVVDLQMEGTGRVAAVHCGVRPGVLSVLRFFWVGLNRALGRMHS
jgi:hypothetical protein